MSEFQCIFCGKKINQNNEKVTSILVTTNWEKEDEQEDQQLFCHLNCLKEKCFDAKNIFIEE